MGNQKRTAELFHKEGVIGDLSGDDLTLTVTAAEADSLPIYIDSVRGSMDVAGDFSITDSNGKVIFKINLPNGGVVSLNQNDFSNFDYADAGYNLVVAFEGDTTPTEIFLQLNAYAYTNS